MNDKEQQRLKQSWFCSGENRNGDSEAKQVTGFRDRDLFAIAHSIPSRKTIHRFILFGRVPVGKRTFYYTGINIAVGCCFKFKEIPSDIARPVPVVISMCPNF